MSATLASLYEGVAVLLHAYLLLESSNLPHGNREWSIIAVWSCLPIERLHELKKLDACTCALRNGVKTETFAPQNDRATEPNVNFLLTATVVVLSRVRKTRFEESNRPKKTSRY